MRIGNTIIRLTSTSCSSCRQRIRRVYQEFDFETWGDNDSSFEAVYDVCGCGKQHVGAVAPV